MAKYEIRKYQYNSYTDKNEYLGECEFFDTFAEVKNYIVQNKNTVLVRFGDVFKNGEYLFNPASIFDYLRDAKYWGECYEKTRPLGLKSLLEYIKDPFSIKM